MRTLFEEFLVVSDGVGNWFGGIVLTVASRAGHEQRRAYSHQQQRGYPCGEDFQHFGFRGFFFIFPGNKKGQPRAFAPDRPRLRSLPGYLARNTLSSELLVKNQFVEIHSSDSTLA